MKFSIRGKARLLIAVYVGVVVASFVLCLLMKAVTCVAYLGGFGEGEPLYVVDDPPACLRERFAEKTVDTVQDCLTVSVFYNLLLIPALLYDPPDEQPRQAGGPGGRDV